MSFQIVYSAPARQDLHDIRAYIHDVLCEPETANKQLQRIIGAVRGLDHLPFRHRLLDHEPWRTMGLRVLPVDNYLILYLPNENAGTVTIARVIYGGRDVPAQLEQAE